MVIPEATSLFFPMIVARSSPRILSDSCANKPCEELKSARLNDEKEIAIVTSDHWDAGLIKHQLYLVGGFNPSEKY